MSRYFPHEKKMNFDGKTYDYQFVLEQLKTFIKDERLQKMDQIINQRSYDFTILCDHIYDIGNINAILRSSDSFGVGSLQIVETGRLKDARRASQGAYKWVDQLIWPSSEDCIHNFKKHGYQVVGTLLSDRAKPYTQIDFSLPTILVLGGEKEGISHDIQDLCDQYCIVPTIGFSQSLNVAVAASLILQEVLHQRIKRYQSNGDLTEQQKDILRAHFIAKSVQNPGDLLKECARRLLV